MESEGIFRNLKSMRRTGYTTNLLEMCRNKNCCIIFSHNSIINHLKSNCTDLEGVQAITLEQFEKMSGNANIPFYLDNSALEIILSRCEDVENSYSNLQKEYADLKERNSLLFDEIFSIRKNIISEQEKNKILGDKLLEIEKISKRGFFLNLFLGIKCFFKFVYNFFSRDSVTVVFPSNSRQDLARVLHGYYLYRKSSPKGFSEDEIKFLRELEKVSLDSLDSLKKDRPF